MITTRNKNVVFAGCSYCKRMGAVSRFYAYGKTGNDTLDLCAKHIRILCGVRKIVREETYEIVGAIF